MQSIYRSTRQGFTESITLAGALTVALAKSAQTMVRVLNAYMHHRSMLAGVLNHNNNAKRNASA